MREMGALGLIGSSGSHSGLGLGSTTGRDHRTALRRLNVAHVQLLASLMGSIVEAPRLAQLAARWIPRVVAGDAIIGLG
jgi:cyclohexanecarboxyl-CoA dehydrogenase